MGLTVDTKDKEELREKLQSALKDEIKGNAARGELEPEEPVAEQPAVKPGQAVAEPVQAKKEPGLDDLLDTLWIIDGQGHAINAAKSEMVQQNLLDENFLKEYQLYMWNGEIDTEVERCDVRRGPDGGFTVAFSPEKDEEVIDEIQLAGADHEFEPKPGSAFFRAKAQGAKKIVPEEENIVLGNGMVNDAPERQEERPVNDAPERQEERPVYDAAGGRAEPQEQAEEFRQTPTMRSIDEMDAQLGEFSRELSKGVFARRTVQMTMLRQALEDCRRASSKCPRPDVFTIEDHGITDEPMMEYQRSMRRLQQAVNVYVDYKQDHINGPTARLRFQAAQNLKNFVNYQLEKVNEVAEWSIGSDTWRRDEGSVKDKLDLFIDNLEGTKAHYDDKSPIGHFRVSLKNARRWLREHEGQQLGLGNPKTDDEKTAVEAQALVAMGLWAESHPKTFQRMAEKAITPKSLKTMTRTIQRWNQKQAAEPHSPADILGLNGDDLMKGIGKILKTVEDEMELERMANQRTRLEDGIDTYVRLEQRSRQSRKNAGQKKTQKSAPQELELRELQDEGLGLGR